MYLIYIVLFPRFNPSVVCKNKKNFFFVFYPHALTHVAQTPCLSGFQVWGQVWGQVFCPHTLSPALFRQESPACLRFTWPSAHTVSIRCAPAIIYGWTIPISSCRLSKLQTKRWFRASGFQIFFKYSKSLDNNKSSNAAHVRNYLFYLFFLSCQSISYSPSLTIHSSIVRFSLL